MTWSGEQTALVGTPTYAQYTEAGGGAIGTASVWTRYVTEAMRVVSDVTFGRSESDATNGPAITTAIYRTADALYRADNVPLSSTLGGAAVKGNRREDARTEARRSLAATGLCFTGLGPVQHHSDITDEGVVIRPMDW